jgi:hypothetical protein
MSVTLELLLDQIEGLEAERDLLLKSNGNKRAAL